MPLDRSPEPDQPENTSTMLRSEEHLVVATVRAPRARVVIRRRVITETVHIPVLVRREELSIEELPLIPDAHGQGKTAGPTTMVLRHEVPVIALAMQAYEKVVVSIASVVEEQTVYADTRREVVTLDD